ncbi:hypothetical protein U9M48_010821 [Paspalum notatum var. saurae]|uniref:Folate-biopterin transporter 1, chloroplastic n=1 Tax=Paspalum notatum var. saurae TaxID=547442 RepID=A0AAQ3SU59_PASNO
MRLSHWESHCAGPFRIIPCLPKSKDASHDAASAPAPRPAAVAEEEPPPVQKIEVRVPVAGEDDDEDAENQEDGEKMAPAPAPSKSCLKKANLGDGKCAGKGNVKWLDLLGKDLTEVKEFEPRVGLQPRPQQARQQNQAQYSYRRGDTELSRRKRKARREAKRSSQPRRPTAMPFTFLLSPSPPPLPVPPSPTASVTAVSYQISAGHGRRRRPLEHGCSCGRPPETALSGNSGARGSYDGNDAAPGPLGLDGSGASSSDRRAGSASPRYQETLTGDTRNADHEGWQKRKYSTDGLSKTRSTGHVKAFGVDLSPDNVAVAIVYFVQGVLGLSRLAVSFYLKDDLHLDPAETAVISGFSALPWLVKPLYGFISDSIPLFGYRRRSYLFLSGLLGALSWSLMATVVDDKYSAALSIILGSLAVAVSDVVVDSMVVERARGESQSTSGSLQSLCWGSSAFGGVVSAYFSGSLVDTYGVSSLIWSSHQCRFVFGVTALLPLMTSTVAVLVNEERVPLGERAVSLSVSGSELIETSKQRIMQIWNSVKQPSIFLPTLFIFLWQATPQSDSAITNKLGFTPEFLGRVKLVTSVASLLGIGVYNSFLKEVPLRKICLVTTLLGSALGMTQILLVTGLNRKLCISDEWFSIGDSLIITVLGQASFMPVLVLAAKLCPLGVEATLFATLMSISNAGSVAGGLVGAGLTQFLGVTRGNFENLALLIAICNVSSLLPLPLLGLLPDESPSTDSAEAKND